MTPLLLLSAALLAPSLPHWQTRDWRLYCGVPGSVLLSDYERTRGNLIRTPDTQKNIARITTCVGLDGARVAAIRGELSLLTDHFERWRITPRVALFSDLRGALFRRLYVHDLGGIIAQVNGPSAREFHPKVAVFSVNADPKRALTAPLTSLRYFLAHELAHAMQRSSRVALDGSAASNDEEDGDWVLEGMADAVGLEWALRRNGAIRPQPDMVDTPVGIRPYHEPLPISDSRHFKTVIGAPGRINEYRTSSFWRFLFERYGGRDVAFFADLLRIPPKRWPDGDTHWIAWLDAALRAQGKPRLAWAFGAFLPEFLSWGFTRYKDWKMPTPQSKYSPTAWLSRGFGGCISLKPAPGQIAKATIPIEAMAGRCLMIEAKAPGYQDVGLDLIIEGPSAAVGGLYLGRGRTEGLRVWDCYIEAEAGRLRSRPTRNCLISSASLLAPPGLGKRTWTLQPERVKADGQLKAFLTLAYFPHDLRRAALDRSDTFTIEVGLRGTRLQTTLPQPKPGHARSAGPLLGAMTAMGIRRARASLPTTSAEGMSDAELAARWMLEPESLGSTGLPASALAEQPRGLPGVAIYRHAPEDDAVDRVLMLAFEEPIPFGFTGRVGGALAGTLDVSEAPPRQVTQADEAPIPVTIHAFDKARLALSFSGEVCVPETSRLIAALAATSPEAARAALCATRGSISASVELPFGEYYLMGEAPAVDPESIRLSEPLPEPTEAEGEAAPPPGLPEVEPIEAWGMGGGAGGVVCRCTCEARRRLDAEAEAIAAETRRVVAALSPEEMMDEAKLLPPPLKARMDASAALDACLARCGAALDACD